MSASRTVKGYNDILKKAYKKARHKKWLKQCKERAEKEVYIHGLVDAETKVIGNEFFLTGKYPHNNQSYFNSWRFDTFLVNEKDRNKTFNHSPAQEILWWVAMIGILAALTVIGFTCTERGKMNADRHGHSQMYQFRMRK